MPSLAGKPKASHGPLLINYRRKILFPQIIVLSIFMIWFTLLAIFHPLNLEADYYLSHLGANKCIEPFTGCILKGTDLQIKILSFGKKN